MEGYRVLTFESFGWEDEMEEWFDDHIDAGWEPLGQPYFYNDANTGEKLVGIQAARYGYEE
jgi:hypothetical protein